MSRLAGFVACGSLLLACALTARGQSPEETIADDALSLFDHLERIGPPVTERPVNPSLRLPESLNDLVHGAAGESHSELSDWLRWIVLKNLPPAYEDNRKWGLQKSVYDGFRFRREGLKLETERKYRTVKHGTWSRYYLELVDPVNTLQLQVSNYQIVAEDRFQFHLDLETPLHAFGRISQWQRDLQWISLSANADVRVRLSLDADVKIQATHFAIPPEFQFEPSIRQAHLELLHFEVHRISQIHGPLAEQLGKGIRELVDDRLDDYSDRLAVKMNEQLAKQRDKLRVSLDQAFPSWLSQFQRQASPP